MSSDICMRTLCVKNLTQPNEKAVASLFGPYGGSFGKVITTTDTNRKDILVEFESEEQATKARNAIHGKMVDGSNLYVDYALFPQTSIASPSSNKPQKQKISVLDRIIKPGNPKYPKNDDKNANPETQVNGKETPQNGGNTPQPKKTFESKQDAVSPTPQYSIVKRNEVAEKASAANGNSGTQTGNKSNNGQPKKTFTTQKKEKGIQRIYGPDGQKKLEIIRPRQDEAKANKDPVDLSKAINSIMRNQPELAKPVYEFVQKKAGNPVVTEAPSKATTDRNDPHYSTSKNRTSSRSRSRTSKSRNIASDSHSKYNSYNYGSPRRSRSRSSSRNRRSLRRSHSRSRSYGRDGRDRRPYSRERSYSGHRDAYYDRRSPPPYKDEYYSSRRSRSRSLPRRDYPPGRDDQIRRDDSRYDYRSRSRSRSKSRGSYYRYGNNPGYSQTKSDKSGNYDNKSSSYYPTSGLVIEKKNSSKMYDDDRDRDMGHYRHRDYSRSRSRDRLNNTSSRRRSPSRERPSQSGWKRSSDSMGYSNNAGRKSPERSRANKGSDMRTGNNSSNKQQQQLEKNQKKSSADYHGYNDVARDQYKEKTTTRDVNSGVNKSNQQENTSSTGKTQYPSTQDLQVGVNNANQIYANYLGQGNLQNYFPPAFVNFASTFVPYPNQSQDVSLPTYMYPPPAAPVANLGSQDLSMVNQDNQIQINPPQTGIEGQITENPTIPQTMDQELGSLEPSKEPESIQKGIIENVGPSTFDTSTTENSNDPGKPADETAIPEESNVSEQKEGETQEMPPESVEQAQMVVEKEGTPQSFSINDLLKKNTKMQGIINYLISTGDIQGLKEKIKSLEKSK